MSIKSRISFEKVHRLIKFNQNAWIKPYIGMSTDLKKEKRQRILKKILLNFMKNGVFGKSKENVRKHRHIKIVVTERRRNCLLSEHLFAHRKSISNKNENNWNTYEKICLLNPLITRIK